MYIHFRNEPSMKSISVYLSLLIFIGCYLLIAFAVVIIADIPPRIDVCMIRWTWNLSTTHSNYPLGQNAPYYKRVKPKVHTSECTHFLYTVFILSPNITILTVWTIVIDPYRSDDTYVEY